MKILVTMRMNDTRKQRLLSSAGDADLLFLPSREVTDVFDSMSA